ncbi:MAG: hypothetical protein IPK97_04545 [Ahniella sp.]|nr:hypothetical protein [Ahniella sp.]
MIYMDGPILRGVIACYPGVNIQTTIPCEVQDGADTRRKMLRRVDFIPQGNGETIVLRVVGVELATGQPRLDDEFVMERVGD